VSGRAAGEEEAAAAATELKIKTPDVIAGKKSEWTKKCKGKAKWAGTQVLDRSWMWLKKSCRIA